MPIILVKHLSKKFKLYHRPVDRLKEAFLGRSYHKNYQALKDISFFLDGGETLGIIGKNGAGKSTLLKILNNILMPDSGIINIEGRITGLLELGTGFDNNLTGRQNIVSNGLLIGMSRQDISSEMDKIIEFTELGDFIDEPLKTYSSGMVMRLAFSIAIHAHPQCFLVDEALAVGDGYFQQKCIRKIREFRDNGGAIIFVSHDLNAVKMLCNRVIVLDQGNVAFEGNADDAVNYYNRIMASLDETYSRSNNVENSYGNSHAEIISANVLGNQSGSNVVASGELVTFEIEILGHENLVDLTIGFMIRDRFGQDIYGTNSHLMEDVLTIKKGQKVNVSINLKMNIAPGKYTLTMALHSNEDHLNDCYHWCDNLTQFEVAGIMGYPFSGVCRLEPALSIK